MVISRKKVLWVDDEIEFLRSHIMFLETRGYSVIPVFTGDDAIQVLKDNPRGFDIVLLDEQMPGKDGLTTLEEIKEMLPELPVVMVTKSEEEHVMENALGKKIDGYLTKPVNPSQILMICKRLLESKQIISAQTSERFIRGFSEMRTALANHPDVKGWIGLHGQLTKWDIDLEKVEDEGIRQTHAGQRSDANSAFCTFVAERYPAWIRGRNNPPLMSTGVVETHLVPLINEGRDICFIVLDCMRLDQYATIEAFLRKYFSIVRYHFYSVLPTSPRFSRTSLFSGLLPRAAGEQYPEIFAPTLEDAGPAAIIESRLLGDHLRRLGIECSDPPCIRIADSSDAQALLRNMPAYTSERLLTVVVDFMRILTKSGSTSAVLREIAPDENAFRLLTKSWFQFSVLFQLIRECAYKGRTVVLTSAHGSVFCSRSIDLYGTKQLMEDSRYQCGERISCDERYAVVIPDPSFYGLPDCVPGGIYAIARENYYFSNPGKFENYQQQYRTSFQHGGISLDEVIAPLSIMTPLLS